jgi:murein DD-endopeptidase MepM/ murein hydrolase activator NlpD
MDFDPEKTRVSPFFLPSDSENCTKVFMKFSCTILFIFLLLGKNLSAEILSFKSYKVEKKDTLFSIAQKFQISTKDIYRWNEKIKKDPRLLVGETIRIPILKSAAIKKIDPIVIQIHDSTTNFHYPLVQRHKILLDFSAVSHAPHKGVLFQASGKLDSVLSIQSGKVVAIDYMDGYGNYIIMQHLGGYYSVYGNLGKILVVEGQNLEQGVRLGITLSKRGLYFQINQGEKTLNPIPLIQNG